MKAFYKYHGTGNDFILIDHRHNPWLNPQDQHAIANLCQRRFGIGADGLILITHSDQADFHMLYFNADGRPSSMCGNGGRCAVQFAKKLGIFTGLKTVFSASDGLHQAYILPDKRIALQMKEVENINNSQESYYLDTGSPHHICFVENPDQINVLEQGQAIRYSKEYAPQGTNVNFVATKLNKGQLQVRTYERGVEKETFSCGTGVVAAALAYWLRSNGPSGSHRLLITTKGGDLEVHFLYHPNHGFRQIQLIGPAQEVFKGELQ